MNFYDKRENVNLYSDMMVDYDNSFIISQVERVLPLNSTLLELGMGTGIDLISLSKKYNVVGSDFSKLFLEDFKLKSDIEVHLLDATVVNINITFDCIYSNKVLQHLSKEDFIISLKNQYNHLNKNGILFHTLWNGEYREEFDMQLRCIYYNKATLEKIVPKELHIEEIIMYSEFEDNDSLILILRKL